MALDSEALRLKAEIEAAFADVQYPGDRNLVESRIPDDLDVAAFFKGVNWQDWKEKPGQLLTPGVNGYLFSLSPAAFRYYLPLYMIFTLTDYYTSDLRLEEVISSVTLGGIDAKWREHTERQMSTMTIAQLKVILEYLEFFKREHSVDLAGSHIDSGIENLRKVINNV